MEINFLEPNSQETKYYNACFSPDNSKVAYMGKQNEIYIADSSDLSEFGFILCANNIEQFLWSPDNKKIMVLMNSKNEICVYHANILKPKNQLSAPIAKLSSGIIETERVMWSPSGDHILIFGIHSSQLIVFDLNNKTSFRRLPTPKDSFNSVAFSPDNSLLAILTRSKNQDTIIIYNTDFVRKTSFALSTLDAVSFQWSPKSQFLVVKDSSDHHLLEVVDLNSSSVVSYSAYEGFLGINEVAISPNSYIIAFGSFDKIIRLRVKTGDTQWKTIEELTHTNEQKHPSIVYSQKNGFKKEIPYTIQEEYGIDSNGFSLISWSYDNTYLAAIADKMPKTVFIWNTKEMSPQVIDLEEKITDVKWSPVSNDCLIASEREFIVHWNQKTEVNTIDIDSDFIVDSIEWSKDGTKVLVSDSEAGAFTIGIIPQE